MRFLFHKGQRLSGAGVDLLVTELVAANPAKNWQPAYTLAITKCGTDEVLGSLSVRLGYEEQLVRYSGHLGYRVEPEFRGHRYALKACTIAKQIFQAHNMDVVWITCNPDNQASVRICEMLGCEMVEIVDLPPDNDMYQRGDRQKCRYRWLLSGEPRSREL